MPLRYFYHTTAIHNFVLTLANCRCRLRGGYKYTREGNVYLSVHVIGVLRRATEHLLKQIIDCRHVCGYAHNKKR